MWVDIQQNYNKAFFNFSIWLSNNKLEVKQKLYINDETNIYGLPIREQFKMISKFFKEKGLNIKFFDNICLYVNDDILYKFSNNSTYEIEIKKLINKGFEYINSILISHTI